MRILWSRSTPLFCLCSAKHKVDSTNFFVVIPDSSRFLGGAFQVKSALFLKKSRGIIYASH
jgi:hypothetical protein